MTIRHCILIGAAFAATFLLTAQVQAGQVRGTTIAVATVYAEPDLKSEVLSRYPVGSLVLVDSPSEGEWYRTHFSRPLKGHTSAWILANTVKLSDATPRSKSAATLSGPQSTVSRETALLVSYALQSTSPSAFQQAVGGTQERLTLAGFSLELGIPLFQGIGARAGIKRMASAQPTYGLVTYVGSVSAQIPLLRIGAFSAQLLAGGGMGMTTSKNTRAGKEATSTILSPHFSAGLSAQYALFQSRFGIHAGVNYTRFEIGAVSIWNGTALEETKLSLSGLNFGGGIVYWF